MCRRAKYCGIEDITLASKLERAKDVIEAFDFSSDIKDINDALEYHNITLFFEAKISLKSWDESTIERYSEKVKCFKEVVGKFLKELKGENLSEYYKQTEICFKRDFVTILAQYNVTKRINEEQFSNFINEYPEVMNFVVQEEKLVTLYDQVVAEHLANKVEYATLVIDHYFIKRGNQNDKTYMPKKIEAQLEQIFQNYVIWDEADPYYLNCVSMLKNVADHKINDKVRFQAHKKYNDFWTKSQRNEQNLFVSLNSGVKVDFRDQKENVIEKYDEAENIKYFSYSRQWIAKHLDYITLLKNFIYLFKYVDKHFRCLFTSNPNDWGIFESMPDLRGKSEYLTGIAFYDNNMISNMQMLAYQAELQSHGIEIENLFKWFFEKYLKEEFGVENYMYFSPTPQASNLEKILLIASQLDAVLKQFRLFIDDGKIDREFFEFSSNPGSIVSTPSMIEKKYIYPNSEEIKIDTSFLFSNNCRLGYLEKNGVIFPCNCFANVLICLNVKIEDYPNYLHNDLKWLLNRKTIFTDKQGYLRIDPLLCNLLWDIYKNGCIAYSYCSVETKLFIDKLLEEKKLKAESTLFTRQEKEYLDFMLNVQQFVNGPELRNKYVHGSFSPNHEVHKNDYLELLKIMTLIVLKIKEEFNLKYPKKNGTGFSE